MFGWGDIPQPEVRGVKAIKFEWIYDYTLQCCSGVSAGLVLGRPAFVSPTSVFMHMCICGHSTLHRARYPVRLFCRVTWVRKRMIIAMQQYIGGVKVSL